MSKILSMPGLFIIGESEISRLAQYVAVYGSPLMLVAHREDAARVQSSLDRARADGIEIIYSDFAGEATRAEAGRIGIICREKGCKAVAGLGGGKAIDTSKVVANELGLPSVIIPTIAATDSPCSRLAVLYTDDHVFSETVVFQKNPDLVLVDSKVIAEAPERFLVAGMGDAFATCYEARACVLSGSLNINKGLATNTAFVLAKACRETLLRDSEKALLACRSNTVTEELENIIEANILLSGIGFESGGLSVAHAVYGGFTEIPDTKGAMHGEIVAIGTLVQLTLENGPAEELLEATEYYKSVGLPTSLKDIGVFDATDEKLRPVVDHIMLPGSDAYNVPFELTYEKVLTALKTLSC